MSLLEQLCMIAADAKLREHRQEADFLLSQELMARINGMDRIVDIGFALSTSVPLASPGGIPRANVFASCLGRLNLQALGGGTIQRGPDNPRAPTSAYKKVLADVTGQGNQLVDAVSAVEASDFFIARRRSVRTVVAAGGLYPLEFWPTQRPGGTEPADGAFRFNTGDWLIRFTGLVYSWDDANPATIFISVAGASRSVVRVDDPKKVAQLGRPLTAPERRSQAVYFDVEVTASFATPHVVFLQNASSFDQYAIGALRVSDG